MKRQVIVVGAGPSGSSAAFHCAKKGMDVLLIDKETWPREKICGDAYLHSIWPILKDMGVFEEMEKHVFSTPYILDFVGPDEQEVYFKETESEWLIQRRIGDDIIRKGALKAGADWMENFEATELIMKKGVCKGIKGLYHNQEITVEADAVIVADGSHSVLSKQAGLFTEDDYYTMIACKGWFTGCTNLMPHSSVQMYDMEAVPGNSSGKNSMVAGWIIPFDEDPTKASVGIGIPIGICRAHNMSVDQYFNWWMENSATAKKYLGSAKCVDGMKGWRLPGSSQPLKNYIPGALFIGDAVAAAECCYYYGIPSGMIGGQVAADILEEAFANNDYSEEMFAKFQTKYTEIWGGKMMFYSQFRDKLISNRDTVREMLEYAQAKEGYPNNSYTTVVREFLAKKGIELVKRKKKPE
jgi:flavin-dependent dehydrogenase